jgi:polyribonucleotide nucleotidyltransferase
MKYTFRTQELFTIIIVMVTSYAWAQADDAMTDTCKAAKSHISSVITDGMKIDSIREAAKQTCRDLGSETTHEKLKACLKSIDPNDCSKALKTLKSQLRIDDKESEHDFFKTCLHIEKLCSKTATDSSNTTTN